MDGTKKTIDKSGWPDGPWKDEPDRIEWVHAGYACMLLRNKRLGHWCGYVGIDRGHRHYGKGYDEPDLAVHGGITYANKCDREICHIPAPGMPDDVWWLGFDCAHAGDFSPGSAAILRNAGIPDPFGEETYRTVAWVKRETEQLAEQLRALASDSESHPKPGAAPAS